MRPHVLALFPAAASAIRILQSNDDGWAEKSIRNFHHVLTELGHDVVLSAPAENKSGTHSKDKPPSPRKDACQYNSCPPNSPAIGTDPENPRLAYVNSYPVTAVKHGIFELSPKQLGGSPDLVLAGPNVGANLDIQVPLSGTIGAAVYAVNEGIPAIAFSGRTKGRLAFDQETPLHTKIYAELASNLTQVIISSGEPYLPTGVFLNVNFPRVQKGHCDDINDFKFVMTRITPGILSSDDHRMCDNHGRLPMERKVIYNGCFVTVSPGDAHDKTTVDAERQKIVVAKLGSLLSCYDCGWLGIKCPTVDEDDDDEEEEEKEDD